MAKQVRVGMHVRYTDATPQVHHARVTAVTSQTVINVAVGRGPTMVTAAAVSKKNPRAAGVGWSW